MKPTVAIIDWKDSPLSEPDSVIEKGVIGDTANVRRYLANTLADLTGEALEADVYIAWHNIPFTAAGMTSLARARAIIRNGVGFDSIDIHAAAARGIPVCNVPDYGTEEVADHAIALALALCRQLFPLDLEAKNLGWHIKVGERMRRFSTQTFGIVGLGRIGTATALRAKALGFRVVFFDPYLPAGVHKALGVERARSLDDLLRVSNVLSIHCPLDERTRFMIDEPQIARLPRGAFLVNTARGAIVRKAAAFAALRSGQLGGAGLDVIEDEPLRTPEEAATPNLIATCHAAFCSVEAKEEMRRTSARIATQVLRGEQPDNRVN